MSKDDPRYITTPHEAEENAAAKMREWGFTDAVATTGGADGGIDVRSSRALAQVKWRGGVAGRPDVQRLFGARGSDTDKVLFFFAASGYSQQAVQYADAHEIGLFVYDPLGKVEAVNLAASGMRQADRPRHAWWSSAEATWIGLTVAALVAVGVLMAAIVLNW